MEGACICIKSTGDPLKLQKTQIDPGTSMVFTSLASLFLQRCLVVQHLLELPCLGRWHAHTPPQAALLMVPVVLAAMPAHDHIAGNATSH